MTSEYYVYAWFVGDELVYIGKGKGDNSINIEISHHLKLKVCI